MAETDSCCPVMLGIARCSFALVVVVDVVVAAPIISPVVRINPGRKVIRKNAADIPITGNPIMK
jgi:hypothetical protein